MVADLRRRAANSKWLQENQSSASILTKANSFINKRVRILVLRPGFTGVVVAVDDIVVDEGGSRTASMEVSVDGQGEHRWVALEDLAIL